MKVIFLNGPPGCGKDFAGELIAEASHLVEVTLDKFARQLKEATHRLYGITQPCGSPAPHDYFEVTKEMHTSEFMGLTPREAYQKVSELYFKQVHGDRVFGEMLLKDIKDPECPFADQVLVITDSGFRGEAEVLVEKFGAENCTLIRIHREGCDFAGDTRSYIILSDLGVATDDIDNPGTAMGLHRALANVIPGLISQKE